MHTSYVLHVWAIEVTDSDGSPCWILGGRTYETRAKARRYMAGLRASNGWRLRVRKYVPEKEKP